ncbi:hypothetical protein J3R82DRAFT_10409 [Butyriboletus roseoflavus]|nr:hypothetical protein J3R82DRAFT_10409 [Butyriboletus roseoflavus]
MAHSAPPLDEAHSSQHADLRILRGTQPGLLDQSQPPRLLRFPDSKLSFASFDPKTALAEGPNVQKLNNSGTLAPPKRIVIEITSKGASFWRFVPRARLEEGAQDEGIWPRVIDICGEKVQCYQEQWEIYKLDPKYHCVVYPWPKCSTLTWVELPNQDLETADVYSGKRSRWPSPEMSEPIAQKKARSRLPDEMDGAGVDSDEDEDEVEEMIIDESFLQNTRSSRRPDPTSREKIKKARLDRWAKHRMAHEKQVQDTTVPTDGSFSMRVDSEDTFPSQSTAWSTEENFKRTSDSFPESDDDNDEMPCDGPPRGHKRARTSSPKTRKGVSRSRHEKKWFDQLRRHTDLNRQYQQKKFAESLRFAFIPPESVEEVEEDETKASTAEAQSQGKDGLGETPLETTDSHVAEIAESIRKLRDLEKDRPIWEAQRKQREARERAEEQERLAKGERRRKEEEERLRQQHEAAEREKRRVQQEAERLAREEELRQRENRQRRQRQRWESGPWTTHRALERYRMLSDEFDAAKFTSGQSIAFHDIPWPVLHAPSHLTVEDVDWSAVETFFATVKFHMRLQDYKEFVEKSHRRFHPDRWRARKIWAAVTDEVERGYLEVAANTVAQAITPIWRAAKEK